MPIAWDIDLGETLLRRELHDRWGGGRYGGMEPAVKAQSVFLFTNPEQGSTFGYDYDGWHDDDLFHYTGDGQVGDQLPTQGGNRALIAAGSLGRPVRLFRSAGKSTTYLGEFELADPPYYMADAKDREGNLRSVLVFRLRPIGTVVRDPKDGALPDVASPEKLPLEAGDVDAYIRRHPEEPVEVVRREAKLVGRYAAWLRVRREKTVRHRIPIPGGGYLFTDLFNLATDELVEAKASAARVYVRTALGQVLDYSRFIDHRSRAVLFPSRPNADLMELLSESQVAAIWEEGKGFARSDPNTPHIRP